MVNLELSDEQLNVISKACELLSRIYIGKLEEVALLFSDLPDEQYQELVDSLKSLNSIIKVTSKQSNSGIRDKNIPEVARYAYDIHQVIRHYLAWKHFPQGGSAVHFDSPNAYGSLSLPIISE
ncbi:hypothetical protein FNW02_29615 [Komarekiella sp. 'clone 1']|uniref:Uncharacterized protein n=1 Tax=Komarekiella delphini-convector SJRDD-AB1 TaxID=2593771 RepID=A0AA40T369_9NOST|nr:hypothetical protein [Komarekiella delphini-convector]MBD6619850.1 hypothetical protein [Komarekiella delphini-convector SJRDD-AB1]